MSRRLLALPVAALAIALGAQVALAQPEISGFVYQDFRLLFGGTDEGTDLQVPDPWVRIYITGDASERISYTIRLVDAKTDFEGTYKDGLLTEAFVVVHDVTPGLNLTVGRKRINWTFLQEQRLDNDLFWLPTVRDRGLGFKYERSPNIRLDYKGDNFELSGFYALGEKEEDPFDPGPPPKSPGSLDDLRGKRFDVLSREELGARLLYSVPTFQDLDVKVGAQVIMDFIDDPDTPANDDDNIGWGVQGQVGRKGFGYLYGEYGQPDTDTGEKFWIVGAKADLAKSLGLRAFFERDIENDESAFEVAKQLNDYMELIFGGDTDLEERGDDEWGLYLVTRFGTTF